jgi:hypothetical protein
MLCEFDQLMVSLGRSSEWSLFKVSGEEADEILKKNRQGVTSECLRMLEKEWTSIDAKVKRVFNKNKQN